MNTEKKPKKTQFSYIAMTVLITTASLEYAFIFTNYIVILRTLKLLAISFLILNLLIELPSFKLNNLISRKFIMSFFVLIISLLGFEITSRIIAIIIRKDKIISIYDIQKLEVTYQMFLYPFSILILCLLVEGYRKWLKNNLKKLTIFLYLFVWIWFGTFYFYTAQRTIGNDFVFSEPAKLETTLKGILKDGQYDSYDESRLKNIIGNYEYKKDYIRINSNEEYLLYDQAGEDWGEIYENMLAKEGYNFYAFQISPERLKITPDMLDFHNLKSWEPYINNELIEVDIGLYKVDDKSLDSQHSVFLCEQSDSCSNTMASLNKPEKAYKLYFMEDELFNFLDVLDKQSIDTHLSHFVANSHTLLDSTLSNIYVGLNGYSSYQIEDFWYFSAITITTVGFGDITPNSTSIRVAVMFEALLGVILIGVYISAITTNKENIQ